jgi:carbamate kinase
MRIVVALGGNALLRRGEPAEAETQRAHVREVAAALAGIAAEHQLVLTHGNGPQVGLLALEADAYTAVAPYPLDILGAESQGMIGYLLVQALQAHTDRDVVALLTQVVVDAGDHAFGHPTKPIGPVYSRTEAAQLAASLGWTVARDGDHFRRVVPSPQPMEIVELASIERLVDVGAVVVCAGGGGVPVVRRDGSLVGVEAVVDKDSTAALLADEIGADRLVLLTDVPYVERDWRTCAAAPIRRATPAELRELRFASGSMAPKVEAACRFAEAGGGAAIGALSDLTDVVAGTAGTQVVPERQAVAAG